MRRIVSSVTVFLIIAGMALAAGLVPEGKNVMPPDEQIQHALARLTFGARPDDAEQVRAMGLDHWIDQQLHPLSIPENQALLNKLQPLVSINMTPAQAAVEYPPKRKLGPADMSDDAQPPVDIHSILPDSEIPLLKSGSPQQKTQILAEIPEGKYWDLVEALRPNQRRQLMPFAPAELRRRLIDSLDPRRLVAEDLEEAKLLRAVYSERQLQEVLVDFWFNHFNVFLEKGADRYLVSTYERDAIRPNVLGKFHDLLLATAKSPAMLFYLDNWQSASPSLPPNKNGKKRGLNENYARELMELHTLGVNGGYTQHDVIEVARCFTGWTIEEPGKGGGFVYRDKWHDKGQKIVLGHVIRAGGGMDDGLKVLDILSKQPATAQFISRQLAIRFVSDNPPQSLVDRMAKTFRKKDGDLREVMKTMLHSPGFWSPDVYRAKVKTPFELIASALRATNADLESTVTISNELQRLGEPLYKKLEPTGYSNQNAEWVSSSGLVERMNFSLMLAQNKVGGVRLPAADPKQLALELGAPDFQKR